MDLPDLDNPHPLALALPGFMQEDDFVVRFTAALDSVLAPVVSVLDCLDSYVDPLLAPHDFVDWLAEWVGAPLDDHWEDALRRRSVLAAVSLHRLRGTVEGLRVLVTLATGGAVEVLDAASALWSRSPTDETGGGEDAFLLIRVSVDEPADVRLRALDELVAAAKPAHLPHTIEVIQR